ncbi:uncharacterized protein METZ01_LOCUS273027, partial [marine metagenome]
MLDVGPILSIGVYVFSKGEGWHVPWDCNGSTFA